MTGNILEAQVEALVNPVNTEGIMGAGLALSFKNKYPDIYIAYKDACLWGQLKVGAVHFANLSNDHLLKWIINFPTKNNYRDPYKIMYIIFGLDPLTKGIREEDIKSIAIPALGCGLGELDWNIIKPILVDWAQEVVPDVEIWLYEPS